jgi:hypothetical protein
MKQEYITVVYKIVNNEEWGKINPLHYEHTGLKAVGVSRGDLIERNEAIDKLRAFAQVIMENWPEAGFDGFQLQDEAVKYGLLEPEIRYESCVDGAFCQCAEYYNEDDFKSGVECFRKTKLLMGES